MSKISKANTHVRNKKTPTQRLTLIWAVGGLTALGMIVIIALFGSTSASASDFSAATLSGQTIELNQYRGQVVMLNFWATWCPPCRAEMPTIQSVYEQHQDEGFVVLALNNSETPTQIQPFVQSLDLRFPVVLDVDGRLQRLFDITGYPTSIFVNPAGDIYAKHNGMISASQLEAYIAQGIALGNTSTS